MHIFLVVPYKEHDNFHINIFLVLFIVCFILAPFSPEKFFFLLMPKFMQEGLRYINLNISIKQFSFSHYRIEQLYTGNENGM